MDFCETVAREGYYAREGTPERQFGKDSLWFLWCGRNSPSFGRDHIATFERRLIADQSTWAEPKNPYYSFYKRQRGVRAHTCASSGWRASTAILSTAMCRSRPRTAKARSRRTAA